MKHGRSTTEEHVRDLASAQAGTTTEYAHVIVVIENSKSDRRNS